MPILPELDETVKIAFIDLDGVLVDNSEREAEAMLAARQCFNFPDEDMRLAIPAIRFPEAWNAIFYSELALYNSEFIKLDKLQEGCVDGLDFLTKRGYSTFFLTSRPDTPELRKATEAWLEKRHFVLDIPLSTPGHDTLIMKPSAVSANRIFTKVWKTITVQQYAAMYKAESVVVVDDDTRNLEEIKKHKVHGECRVFESFQEMREALEKDA